MVRVIIFDCFGVLTADKWREFTATLPDSQREEASALNRAYDAGILTQRDFLQHIHELTGREPDQVEHLLDSETYKNTELLNYIRQLKAQYKIGMISNIATNWVRDHFLTSEEQQLFDDMVFSFEVHMAKPDPRIFELAAERLGAPPNECVFVDDVEGYCTAAAELGMQTVVYQDFPQAKSQLERILRSS